MSCDFTFGHYKEIFEKALDRDFKIVTCLDYFLNHKRYKENNQKVLINRIDVDLSCKKLEKVIEIFKELDIKASFFIRLHASEYNPFSFENYRIITELIKNNHEIGLHSEVIDCEKIFEDNAEFCLRKDLKILTTMFEILIEGVASHRGATPFNNLDFWKTHSTKEFGIRYEAYDSILFNNFYVSDSLFTWNCYNNGIKIVDDKRCMCQHLKDNHRVIYFLTHPIHHYERYPYES